jgi:hypothetical protein
MNNKLTTDEERIIVRMESAGKWDHLFHDLGYLVPFAIIIILSVIYGSTLGVFLGLLTYSVLRLWTSLEQCKSIPLLQSAIKKLKAKCQQGNPADGS